MSKKTELQKRVDKLQRIVALQDKQRHLLQILEYYVWLEQHGVYHEDITGVAKSPSSSMLQQDFKNFCRRNGHMDLWEKYNMADMVCVANAYGLTRWVVYKPEVHGDKYKVERRRNLYRGEFISLQMKSGAVVVLPWPPFPESVIFGRSA